MVTPKKDCYLVAPSPFFVDKKKRFKDKKDANPDTNTENSQETQKPTTNNQKKV